MSALPREPEAFTEQVAPQIAGELTWASVWISGPLEVTIDGRPHDLTNLYKAIHVQGEEAGAALQRWIEAYRESRRLEELVLPFEMVRPRIFPRIEPSAVFREQGRAPDFVAHQPYVNGTVILYVVDLSASSAPVTTEQMIRWGVGIEELDGLARHNLAVQQPRVEVQIFEEEPAVAARFTTGDGYDASRLLLEELHESLAPELGGDFLVAIPTRDVFLAFSSQPEPFVDRVHRRIAVDYRKLPYPITDHLFLVTLDGVAGWSDAA